MKRNVLKVISLNVHTDRWSTLFVVIVEYFLSLIHWTDFYNTVKCLCILMCLPKLIASQQNSVETLFHSSDCVKCIFHTLPIWVILNVGQRKNLNYNIIVWVHNQWGSNLSAKTKKHKLWWALNSSMSMPRFE